MHDQKIAICFATKGAKEETITWNSLHDKSEDLLKNISIKCNEYNKKSLQECYNVFLDDCRRDGINIALLVHDDIYINCSDFESRVIRSAEMFTVFGLAGCTTCKISTPALWHLMSKREEQRGCVAHGTKDNYFYTSFGSLPSRVLLIDGVFIGLNLSKIPKDLRFDESYPSRFHYYDLDFSLECNKRSIKIGVVDIPIIHSSPGLTNPTSEFYSGQQYFINKWKK
jgi:hypothetical protein